MNSAERQAISVRREEIIDADPVDHRLECADRTKSFRILQSEVSLCLQVHIQVSAIPQM